MIVVPNIENDTWTCSTFTSIMEGTALAACLTCIRSSLGFQLLNDWSKPFDELLREKEQLIVDQCLANGFYGEHDWYIFQGNNISAWLPKESISYEDPTFLKIVAAVKLFRDNAVLHSDFEYMFLAPIISKALLTCLGDDKIRLGSAELRLKTLLNTLIARPQAECFKQGDSPGILTLKGWSNMIDAEYQRLSGTFGLLLDDSDKQWTHTILKVFNLSFLNSELVVK